MAAGRPLTQHLRSMDAVAVVEVGDMAEGGEAAEPAGRAGVAKMRSERSQPRLVEVGVNQVNKGPNRPLGAPRVGIRIYPGYRGQRPPDEGSGEREVHVGTHSIGTALPYPQPARELLGEPTLDAPGRDCDDFALHRIVKGIHDKVPQHGDQCIGPLRSVNVQHVQNLRPNSGKTGSCHLRFEEFPSHPGTNSIDPDPAVCIAE